jgi:hypothetical protein
VPRLSIVELLEQCAQLRDVLAAELAVAAEVRHQRRHPAVEQPLQQALAFAEQPVLSLEHRGVEIAAPVAVGADGALAQQTVQQGLDRGFLPVPCRPQGLHHVLGRHRLASPKHLHDLGFGLGDLHRLHL